jgi:hypothetical protein
MHYTEYKISLWKVDPNEPAVILGEQRIEVSREVFVLKNKLCFSQDGRYIFLVFVDNDRNLWRSIALDAYSLNHVQELDLDLRELHMNGNLFKQSNNIHM